MDDLIVIGAGPAGLSAGLFAGLYKLQARIIGESIGGEVKLAPMIFDYPGIKQIRGSDWLQMLLAQVQETGVQIHEQRVTAVSRSDATGSRPVFSVQTETDRYEARALIFATGNQKRRPTYSGPQLARSLGVSLSPDELIDVDQNLATNLPGVFAAGNCLEHPIGIEQLVDAAAQGTRAAAQAYEYLKGQPAPILWGKATIPNI